MAERGQPHDVELPEQVTPLLWRHRHLDLVLTLGQNLDVWILILKLEIHSCHVSRMPTLVLFMMFKSLLSYKLYSTVYTVSGAHRNSKKGLPASPVL